MPKLVRPFEVPVSEPASHVSTVFYQKAGFKTSPGSRGVIPEPTQLLVAESTDTQKNTNARFCNKSTQMIKTTLPLNQQFRIKLTDLTILLFSSPHNLKYISCSYLDLETVKNMFPNLIDSTALYVKPLQKNKTHCSGYRKEVLISYINELCSTFIQYRVLFNFSYNRTARINGKSRSELKYFQNFTIKTFLAFILNI